MKALPIGKQNFKGIIEEDMLYLDKTQYINELIKTGNLYFLSRPRRFGKSLLISLLSHLFNGEKELFKDLYIGKSTDYDFQTYPVLQFNFASFGHKIENIDRVLKSAIAKYAAEYEIQLEGNFIGEQLKSLVKGISEKGKPVVFLVDEYDKPIIDFITETQKATTNREVLKSFFSPLKELEGQGHIRFLFITGVSKFSKVSLFSDLNNLIDLSIDNPLSNALLGITHEELTENFQPYIKKLSQKFKITETELLKNIKKWYNGYSYDGIIKLCNPFSLLSFFQAERFGNFWFATGTPTFLVNKIREDGLRPQELRDIVVTEEFFHKFSLSNLDMRGLLFQTGYLTISHVHRRIWGSRYYLDYPNYEVKRALTHNLVEAFTFKKTSTVSIALVKMEQAFEEGNVEKFVTQLESIIADISYHLHPPTYRNGLKKSNQKENPEVTLFKMWEGYFHTIVYLVTSYMEMFVRTEVTKHQGRLDLIAETDDYIYLMEFKLDENATVAIEQIKNKKYAVPYQNSNKTIFLVGINFSKEERNVESWQSEIWER